jgi:branched-chain amino acid aminotransferase
VYCWLNGSLCLVEDARVPVLDRGFLYGDTLFETVRFSNGRVHWLSRHLARMGVAAERLGFVLPRPLSELPALIEQVISANQCIEGVIRITLSRGMGSRGPNPSGASHPTLLISQSPMPAGLEELRQRGYRLTASPWRKPAPDTMPNWAKHGNYLNSVMASKAAFDCGADEAYILAHDGSVAECATGNLFFVSRDELWTPDASSGALLGVMRSIVLDVSRHIGLRVHEGRVDEAVWQAADEVMLTNAVRGVMPVAAMGECRYRIPGRWTTMLAARIEALAAVGGGEVEHEVTLT